MKNLYTGTVIALFLNSADARTKWQEIEKDYNGDKFAMRWYSYVPEEDAEEGAIFAPTIELNFKDSVDDNAAVRLCLSYRAAETLDPDGVTVNVSGDQSDLEIMCAYTKTTWKAQDWQIKWAKQI
jgi:hypothetical protein